MVLWPINYIVINLGNKGCSAHIYTIGNFDLLFFITPRTVTRSLVIIDRNNAGRNVFWRCFVLDSLDEPSGKRPKVKRGRNDRGRMGKCDDMKCFLIVYVRDLSPDMLGGL